MGKLVRSPLFLMALTIFIDFTGFGLVIPLLPFWAERVGANPVGVGLVLTVYALAQFLFTPVLGSLSDRFGRRPIIVASLVIEFISFALTALAGSLPLLLLARFVGGLGASSLGTAQAVVSDVTPPEGRAHGMGLIGAAIGMGFVVGPALGGALAPLGPAVPFWVAGCVALVNALLVLSFLPETRKLRTGVGEHAEIRVTSHKREGLLFAGWRNALRSPVIARLVAVNLLFTLAFTAMEAVFPLFTQRFFGWRAMQNGYVFTYVGIIVIVMQGGLVGRLVKRFGERVVLLAGLVLLAAGLALLPWSTSLALLLVSLGILSAGDGAITPTISTLLSFAAPEEAQGESLGFAQGVGGLGRIVGPLAAGSLFALGAGIPFLAAAGLTILAFLLALFSLPRRRQEARVSLEEGEAREEEVAREEARAEEVARVEEVARAEASSAPTNLRARAAPAS